MIRVALIFLFAVLAFVSLRLLLGNKSLTNRQFGLVYIALLLGVGLLYLGISGRLHWLFGLLGAALPFVARSLPWIVRLAGMRAALNWLRQFRAGTFGGTSAGSTGSTGTGRKSELNTRFFAMVLDHDSGAMDGEILAGAYQGKQLSQLDLESLLGLLEMAREDPDSTHVLGAYLDRHHPGWRDQADAGASGREEREPPGSDGALSVNQAYEILGLPRGADRDQVRDAHRRLIQKVHPDRGGSGYLAARINEAKTVLLKHLG
ncbi:MAG: DnaJ domain-containing protein [Pseudomonadales bacterium]